MKEKLFRTVTTLILILCLISLDFVLLGYNVVLALSDSGISGDVSTNIQNVEFDAYFKQENTNLYEKQIDVANEDILYLRINVKNRGVLNNAKIQLDNVNFSILKEKTQNEYIQDINTNSNEITLKSITAGNDIEIGLSIQFKKQETFDVNYFGQENTIKISGTYQDEKEQELSGEKKVKVNWTGNTDVILTESIDKYFSLNEKGVLLQQNILTEVQENRLPREKETLNISVPVIKEQKPIEVYAILNGKKMSDENVIYNQENSTLEIVNEKMVDAENNLTWGSVQNQYKVIYIYSSEIGEDNNAIEINTTLRSKLFTKDEIQKQDTQNLEIAKMGNVLDIQKNSLQQQIYKGYLYANVQNEVTFEEEEKVDIAYADVMENIQIDTLDNQFANDANQEFTAGTSVNYKGIVVNKQNMAEILGENGSITIQDENNNVIATINNSVEANENGDIDITYDGNRKNIKVITSKPITEGRLAIKHKKVISGASDYTKDVLKTFTRLISRSKVVTSMGEIVGETAIALIDTKTDAKIELSNTSLSTLQTNENVQFLVTLNSNNEQYDLFKNPTIEIVLPRELNINVKNITQLNKNDELSVVNPKISESDTGEKIISLQLQGEQASFGNNVNEGIQISITADITIDKTVPSMSSQIEMRYTNENRAGEQFSYQLPITINSKYGVLLINKLSNYNVNGDVLENLDDKTKEVITDINAEARVASQEILVMNNYENDISNISLIGKFPENITENINNEEFKATCGMKLVGNIVSIGKAAKIYYSEDVNATKDSDTWQETVEDFSTIKSFKVEIEDNKLEPGAILNISAQLNIPENLGYDQSTYIPITLNYEHNGDSSTSNSFIKIKTKADEKKTVETNSEQMSVQVNAESGLENLEDGQEIKEGQAIIYNIKLTNNSDQDISNIRLEATNTNAIYYDEVEYPYELAPLGDSEFESPVETITKIEENPELQSKIFDIEVLKVGESIDLSYQISVKDDTASQMVEGNLNVKTETIDENVELMKFQIVEGKLKLKVQNLNAEETILYSRNGLPLQFDIQNITEGTLNDVIVEVPVPEEWEFTTELSRIEQTDKCEYIGYENGVANYRINEIGPDETINIYIQLVAKSIPTDVLKIDTALYYRAYYDENEYISNTIKKEINQLEGNISLDFTSDVPSETTVKNGDVVTYTANIKNNGVTEQYLSINSNITDNAVIEEAYISSINGDVIQNLDIYDNTAIYTSYELKPEEEINIVTKARVNTEVVTNNKLINSIQMTGVYIDESAEIVHLIEGMEDEETYHSIDGTVWVDENENGTKDSYEQKLSNVNVMLLNEQTGEIYRDSEGEPIETITNEYGEYRFENIPEGNYIVAFGYDSTRYIVTEYQKQGVSDNLNSDVISKTVNVEGREMQLAITKTLNISTKDLNDIDAGFMLADEFDMKLDKYISKIIVQDNTGTKVNQYNKSKLAKVEVDARRVYNTTITIEYTIEVTNEGDVAGYANEIVDYVPNDLEFSSEINKDWYQGTDGYLYTKQLSDQIINPGETKQINLVLVKRTRANDLGTISNTAEIGKDDNNLSIQDKDSTAGNRVNGEDDMSTAEVIVSIRTGTIVMYTSLIFIILAIIITGIYFINKKVLVKDEDDFIL